MKSGKYSKQHQVDKIVCESFPSGFEVRTINPIIIQNNALKELARWSN